MIDLKLQTTTVTQTPDTDVAHVRVLFADDQDPDAASGTILIDLPVEIAGHRPLLEYQAAALRHARSAIDDQMTEIQRLAGRRTS